MKRESWKVGDHGIRPNGNPDQCFYCNEPRGADHRPDCVIRQRTVVVEVTIALVRSVPEFWHQDLIEDKDFMIGCGSNLVDEICDLENRRDAAGMCLCNAIMLQRFVREATEQDEADALMYVERMPT